MGYFLERPIGRWACIIWLSAGRKKIRGTGVSNEKIKIGENWDLLNNGNPRFSRSYWKIKRLW
jgi:hypothetical protein